jgi:hypothetical protein
MTYKPQETYAAATGKLPEITPADELEMLADLADPIPATGSLDEGLKKVVPLKTGLQNLARAVRDSERMHVEQIAANYQKFAAKISGRQRTI